MSDTNESETRCVSTLTPFEEKLSATMTAGARDPNKPERWNGPAGLRAVYDLGRADAEESAKPRWIAVEERLPPLGEAGLPEYVLFVWGNAGVSCVSLGSYDPVNERWFDEETDRDGDRFERLGVTHWQPLPEPP